MTDERPEAERRARCPMPVSRVGKPCKMTVIGQNFPRLRRACRGRLRRALASETAENLCLHGHFLTRLTRGPREAEPAGKSGFHAALDHPDRGSSRLLYCNAAMQRNAAQYIIQQYITIQYTTQYTPPLVRYTTNRDVTYVARLRLATSYPTAAARPFPPCLGSQPAPRRRAARPGPARV